MPRVFELSINGLASLTAVPFAQLATPTTTGIRILLIELGQHTTTTNAYERLTFAFRSTASTLPTSTTPVAYDRRNSTVSLLTGSTTTNATGIATATGTLTATVRFPPFSVLNGFYWKPIPEEMIHLPVSAFGTLQFEASPAAATWTGRIVFEEE